MPRWSSLGLVALFLLAGCSAGSLGTPTPQEEPAPVELVNNATIVQTYEVAVVPVGANLTVSREDGDTFNQSIGPGSSTTSTTTDNKDKNIELPNSARRHGNYTLEPGEKTLTKVEGLEPDKAVVVLVYDVPEEQYRAIKSLTCGQAILGYRVTSQKGGSDDWTISAHSCG